MNFTNRNSILFDLDGTLTDSSEGIFKSTEYALNKFGIEVEDLNTLRPFIGPPLVDAFSEYYHFSEEDAKKATSFYRERYMTVGKFENRVYDGIKECLETLVKNGKKLYLATAKPELYAVQIMEHFGLDKYFTFMGGAMFEGSRTHKPQVIEYVLAENNIAVSDAVMVGDRHHDIEGAHDNNIPCIGVLYGFGDRKELENANADAIVNDVKELTEIFLKAE